jgi:hypothetical protein
MMMSFTEFIDSLSLFFAFVLGFYAHRWWIVFNCKDKQNSTSKILMESRNFIYPFLQGEPSSQTKVKKLIKNIDKELERFDNHETT